MVARNDITGEPLVSKVTNDAFRNNYDAIFGKKNKAEEKSDTQVNAETQETKEEK